MCLNKEIIMNERIKELIQMADLCAAGLMASGATEEEIQNRSKVVLVSLIVRECADVALREDHEPDECILRHFGVKR
jgi:hypothetical protein